MFALLICSGDAFGLIQSSRRCITINGERPRPTTGRNVVSRSGG